jgi:UDP-3-O-[3-hydroxymyristoyl] glucosamine N-acyltransferase
MRLPRPHRLADIAEMIGARMIGDADHSITGINEIHVVEPGDIVFVDHPKYYQKALDSAATTILIDTDEVDIPEGKALLVSEDPFRDFNKLNRHFRPTHLANAAQDERAEIGEGTHIAPGVHLGARVRIGKDCILHPGVVVQEDVTIGDRVIIHPNSVIGGDAFYYQMRAGGRQKMHTCGGVHLGDDVEIGSASTIDRGVTGITRIGARSKLDCQVHVGHDTVIGEDCLIAAQVGISGCVRIDDNVTLWGQVGIPSDLHIGEGAVLLGQSGIIADVPAGETYFGSPAKNRREAFKDLAYLKKLPELFKKKG